MEKRILIEPRRWLGRWIWILCGVSAMAFGDEYPRALTGMLPPSEDKTWEILVTEPVLQLALSNNVVLSANQDAILGVTAIGEAEYWLSLRAGNAIVLDTLTNRVFRLHRGIYRIRGDAIQTVSEEFVPVEYRQGFNLADAIMVREDFYLDQLRIDVKDINHGLSDLIRSLFSGSRNTSNQ